MFLVNVGFWAMVRGRCVVHYTMEISERMAASRYDDRIMRNRRQYRTQDPKRYVKELAQRVKTYVRAPLIVKQFPTEGATVADLRSHLEILRATGISPDLIIVDYAALLNPTRRHPGRHDLEVDDIFRELRALGQEMGAAVWTGAQATTAAFDKDTLTLSDFRDSRGIAAIVDYALAFCQTKQEEADNVARLFGLAFRHHDTGMTISVDVCKPFASLTSTGLRDASGLDVDIEGGISGG
jgi:replicative DNA helicase